MGLLRLHSLKPIAPRERCSLNLFGYGDMGFDRANLIGAQGRGQTGKSADQIVDLVVGRRGDDDFEPPRGA